MRSGLNIRFLPLFCVAILLVGLVWAPFAQAQTVVETVQAVVAASHPTGHELDLSSTQATNSASFLSNAVTIDHAGAERTIQPTDVLTAAEHIAVLQSV